MRFEADDKSAFTLESFKYIKATGIKITVAAYDGSGQIGSVANLSPSPTAISFADSDLDSGTFANATYVIISYGGDMEIDDMVFAAPAPPNNAPVITLPASPRSARTVGRSTWERPCKSPTTMARPRP